MSDWTRQQQVEAVNNRDMTGELTASILFAYKTPSEPLTLSDRCDACGAAAQVRMHRPPTDEHPTRKGVLEFCGHHYRKNSPKLLGDGWAVAVKTDW